MKYTSVIIDLLETDLDHIPHNLPADTLLINQFAAPNDNDLALRQSARIMAELRVHEILVPALVTIFIPCTPYGFGCALALSGFSWIPPKVIVQSGSELFDLDDFHGQGQRDQLLALRTFSNLEVADNTGS